MGAAPPSDPIRDGIAFLLSTEPYVQPLGIRLLDCAQGWARLSMTLPQAAANYHGTGHGGALFTYADLTFGAAAMYDGPIVTVHSDFHFQRPARLGMVLIAEGRELSRTSRNGLFTVTLTEDGGAVVASGLFNGRWIKKEGPGT
jgi:acyl-CoA thioesterase